MFEILTSAEDFMIVKGPSAAEREIT